MGSDGGDVPNSFKVNYQRSLKELLNIFFLSQCSKFLILFFARNTALNICSISASIIGTSAPFVIDLVSIFISILYVFASLNVKNLFVLKRSCQHESFASFPGQRQPDVSVLRVCGLGAGRGRGHALDAGEQGHAHPRPALGGQGSLCQEENILPLEGLAGRGGAMREMEKALRRRSNRPRSSSSSRCT